MHPITLHNDPDSVTIQEGVVSYLGEYIGQPIVIETSTEDLLRAEPQLAGEPADAAVRMAHQICRVANYYVEAGREPDEIEGGYRLRLSFDDLYVPRTTGVL